MKKSLLTYFIGLLMVVLSGFSANGIQAQPIAEVGGTIATDRFFTNDSLYIVTENLRVINGALLKIEAGTRLKFNQGKGLVIESAKLEAIGIIDEQVDSIHFEPNYYNPAQGWKWKGIQVRNASAENNVVLSYVVVANAEIAVEMLNSKQLVIENSCFINNLWRGISIQNSTNVSLKNSTIYGNYVGLEIVGLGALGVAADNVIQNNMLHNLETNVLIRTESGGQAYRNVITENVVQGGFIGIWIDNSGVVESKRNTISKNAILLTGNGFGYGLYLAIDSTLVTQNIFWQNSSAIGFRNSSNNIIHRNSFYQNGNSMPLTAGSKRNAITNNTFSQNRKTAVIITEPVGNALSKNNFMHSITDTLVKLTTSQNINATANYWGTTLAEEIDKKIFDANDDSELGELFYVPFLEEADTVAPLAPPFDVKKQWVNNRMKLSWRANEESHLRSYVVYLRNFVNYSFSERLPAILDTVFYLDDVAITDTIAVTASERNMSERPKTFWKFESPYAFARAVPYAGGDTAICQNEQVFVIRNANAPFTYLRSVWSTSGDGFFTAPNNLRTSYLPGVEDYNRGEVKLSLQVTTTDEVFVESFMLSFSSDPLAYAGNDTLIGSDSNLRLNMATAAYFDQINWRTTGDGVFEDQKLINTIYMPGDQDKLNGEVLLILEAFSECGVAADTLKLILLDEFSLAGKVYGENQSIQNAMVLAFRMVDNDYSFISSQHTTGDGSFYFEKLFTGDYVLMAAPDTLDKLTASAYYAEATGWEAAYKLRLIEPTYDVDIKLANRLANFPAGTAVINGHFAWPENGFSNSEVYCADWFSRGQKLQYCDGGLSNVSIILYNTDFKVLLSYTLTDYGGRFMFDSLPFGSYRIQAEIPGYPLNVSPLIILSGDRPLAEVELYIENQKINIFTENNQLPSTEKIMAYPNPVSDYLFLQHTNLKEITIFDHFGRLLEVKTFEANTATSSYTLDMQAYKAGFYLLILRSDKQLQTLKVVKY
ncbi:MAG: right-handed parallel beta-helix repeat-containing protein [Bacteroidales bacterium]|nr:right-handed parallel beta-helix repeat-containing protein [Bacteroidales bacterium]